MPAYLLAEEGPLKGLVLDLNEGEEWTLGQDPEEATLVLDDPSISQKQLLCRLTPEGITAENLSNLNPTFHQGMPLWEPVLLQEGDKLQIGDTLLRFSEKPPAAETASTEDQEIEEPTEKEEEAEESKEEDLSYDRPPEESEEEAAEDLFQDFEELSPVELDFSVEGRWLLKVISGPNTGAEFPMEIGRTYILGKDPSSCDILFQDLTVSKQHARLSIDEEGRAFIEDLASRNGVLLNGEPIEKRALLSSQDLIALGTTSFLTIDREEASETLYSPIPSKQEPSKPEASSPEVLPIPELLPDPSSLVAPPPSKEEVVEPTPIVEEEPKDWKELIIPKRHLVGAGFFSLVLLLVLAALFSLFKSTPLPPPDKDESTHIQEAIKHYPGVQFSYNPATEKLFLVGHVLTPVEKQELLYTLKAIPFIENIEDTVVVDEFVWQNMNALLASNAAWQGISITSPSPGHFVMKGYLPSSDELQELTEYVNLNFPYLDRLQNEVVVEDNLNTQIHSLLLSKGFSNVTYQLANGELVLSGRVDALSHESFTGTLTQLKELAGIRQVKNFVVFTSETSSRIDISDRYPVSGYSKKDNAHVHVVIKGHILTQGDALDGMTITAIQPNVVLLEKDGLKFRINYNLQ